VGLSKTRGQGLRVKKMRDRRVLRKGSFSRRVVNPWDALPRKLVAEEGCTGFNWNYHQYQDALEIEGYEDIGRISR